jgi:hypothetical protein
VNFFLLTTVGLFVLAVYLNTRFLLGPKAFFSGPAWMVGCLGIGIVGANTGLFTLSRGDPLVMGLAWLPALSVLAVRLLGYVR